MKKLKLKPPYLHYLMISIQQYKESPTETKECMARSIDALLEVYSKKYDYKFIKFLPTWWKKDNGKVYLKVKFQLIYLDDRIAYYNFSQFDKIIKAYNKYEKAPH